MVSSSALLSYLAEQECENRCFYFCTKIVYFEVLITFFLCLQWSSPNINRARLFPCLLKPVQFRNKLLSYKLSLVDGNKLVWRINPKTRPYDNSCASHVVEHFFPVKLLWDFCSVLSLACAFYQHFFWYFDSYMLVSMLVS